MREQNIGMTYSSFNNPYIRKYPLAELSQRILDSANGLVVFVVNVL